MTGRLATWLWRFLRGHRPALVGFLLVAGVCLAALIGPALSPYGMSQATAGWQDPGAAHWLGTDSQGYDLLTRLLHGARTTLQTGLLATLLSLALGTLAGAVAGYAGGRTDMAVMRVVDFAMSFPSFLLAMVTVSILGRDLVNVMLAVGIVGAPVIARQIRAEVLRISAMEYVTAARALGVKPWRILLVHVLPNSVGPVIVLGTLGMGSAILDVAGLNFLGLGGDPYLVPEWGMILNQGWQELSRGTLQVTSAGLCIFLTVLGFNLLGDGLRDELDPRTRRR